MNWFKNYNIDLYWHSYLVELFGIEEHKNCIILRHTIYSGFPCAIYQIIFANDTDSKKAEDEQNFFTHIFEKIKTMF